MKILIYISFMLTIGSGMVHHTSPVNEVGSSTGDTGVNKRSCVVSGYESFIGVRELTGKNDGPEVEMFLASVNLSKGYNWCGAMPNYVLQQCDCITPKSAAWSPSWFTTERTIYTKGKDFKKIPQPGDIFGIYYASMKRIAHMGFVHEWGDGSSFTSVEGNTSNDGSRNGTGVYKKWRLKSQVYKISDWIN